MIGSTARRWVSWVSMMILYGTLPPEVMADKTFRKAYCCLKDHLGTPVVGFVPSALSSYSVAKPKAKLPLALVELKSIVPELELSVAVCPACVLAHPQRLYVVIAHLNDQHKWTRERIADWLETLPLDLTLKPLSKGN